MLSEALDKTGVTDNWQIFLKKNIFRTLFTIKNIKSHEMLI